MIRVEQAKVRRIRPGDRPVVEGSAYTRISSVPKALDDTTNLTAWMQRQVVIGMSKSPDLIAVASTTKADAKKDLDSIVKQAMERARSKAAASIGTAIHAAAEALDYGEDITDLPEQVQFDAAAYRSAIDAAGMSPAMGEVFVANSEFKIGGSFDRLLLGPAGGHAIGDIKTGEPKPYDIAKFSALGWAVQLACYANSTPYCPERGWLSWESLGVNPPNTSRGVVIHIEQGTGAAKLYLLDLAAGWQYAKAAFAVREARRIGPSLATAI